MIIDFFFDFLIFFFIVDSMISFDDDNAFALRMNFHFPGTVPEWNNGLIELIILFSGLYDSESVSRYSYDSIIAFLRIKRGCIV